MPSSYSTNLKIELQATGENSGTWGTITNTNLGTALEQAIVGYGNPSYASDANLTLTYTDTNAAQAARALVLNVTSAVSLTNTRELVVPTIQKQYIVQNNTTGSQSITVKTSAGTGITVPNGRKAHLYVDGTNVIYMDDYVDINGGAIDGTPIGANSASTGAFTTLSASGNITVSGGTANGVLYLNGSKVATSGSALTFDGTQTFSLFATGNAVTNLEGSTTNNAILRFRNGTTGALAGFYGNNSKELVFEANGTTEQMRLNSTGLGIGTSSPAYKLDVAKTGTVVWGRIGNSDNSGAGWIIAGSSGKKNWVIANQYNVDGGLEFTQTTAAGGSAIGSTPAMTLDVSGNLGIGTSSPSQKLTVAGAINISADATNPNSGVSLWSQAGIGATLSGFNLAFNTGSNGAQTEKMRLDSSGNLGLGVTPSAWTTYNAFQVKYASFWGDASAFAAVGANYYYGNSAYRYISNGVATDYYQSAGAHVWRTAASGTAGNAITFTQAMTLDASGNLGIGTASPSTNLQIGGTAASGSASGGLGVFLSRGVATNFYEAFDGTKSFIAGVDNTNAYAKVGTLSNHPLAIVQANGDALYIDTSKNVGIGTTSPGQKLSVAGNVIAASSSDTYVASSKSGVTTSYLTTDSNGGNIAVDGAWPIRITTNGSERARITSAGNLGIGTTSPVYPLVVSAAGAQGLEFDATAISSAPLIQAYNRSGSAYIQLTYSALQHVWQISGSEKARITSGGEFLIGATAAIASEKLYVTGSNANYITRVYNSNASPNGMLVSYTGAAPNGTGNEFLRCDDTGALRASIRSNGGLANYQSNNVDLSDARTKKDITPAASMWDKIGALEIVTYKYNDQTHDDVNVGVIAQQVESVEPVWVDNDGFGETPQGEEPLKTVYTKDITFAAIKALQEAMARIEKLEAEVAALKGA